MADLPQVEAALVARLAAVIYPRGTTQPSAVGAPVRVYRGWPDADALTRDLAAGTCHVTVYPRGGVSNVMPDALTRWDDRPRPAPSLTVAPGPGAEDVTFAGTGGPLMVAAVVADDAQAWTLVVGPDDTAESVAAAMAATIAAERPASASGAVLTVPGARIEARVFAGGEARRRIRTQRQGMQVAIWCPNPLLRDRLGLLLDAAIADAPRLPVADGTIALLHYNGTMSDDGTRAQPLYRRDLLLTADYDTVISRELPPVVVIPIRPVPATDTPIKAVIVN